MVTGRGRECDIARRALPAGLCYGNGRPTSQTGAILGLLTHPIRKARRGMIKPEWGTKRTCPKCATRFYDLGKDDPVTCINCGTAWEPEPILKSKQPLPFEAAKPEQTQKNDSDLEGSDLDIDVEEEEPSADDEVDLGGDDDLGVDTGDDHDEN